MFSGRWLSPVRSTERQAQPTPEARSEAILQVSQVRILLQNFVLVSTCRPYGLSGSSAQFFNFGGF